MATHLFSLHRHGAASQRHRGRESSTTRLVTGAVRSFSAPTLHSIAVLQGRVWITVENDRIDHLLGAGDVFVPSAPGRIVLEALTPATIEVDQG